MARNDARDIVERNLGPQRSTRQVLATAAGAPTTVLSTFEFPVNATQSPANSQGQSTNTPASDVTSQIAQLNNGLAQLLAAQEANTSGLVANTVAVGQNTATRATGASAVLGTAGNFASSIVGGGLLAPLISGLFGLFGGSSSSAPAPLVKFALPPTVNYQGGQVGGPGGQIAPVDSGQTGQPRAATQAPATQVSIQVNALDSKSFLDHSDEIAQAVRNAILSSSSLNDVISDL